MSHAATPRKNPYLRPLLLTIIALLSLALIATGAWLLFGQGSPPPTPSSPSASPSTPTRRPSPVPTETPSEGKCTTAKKEFVPTSFTMDGFDDEFPVMSLNVDEHGNIAAPPKDLPHTASWWNAGPKPGSDAGKAVLSVHTYRNGGALGNEMYSDDGPTLQPGDIIRLVSAKGKVQCYEFTGATKIWVKDYDPDSDVMVDFHGDPQLLIIICWDFNKSTEIWESRIFFHGVPVA
ncbi:MAG: class F sortase [Tessaracoccus sp.]|uniref:class F sortase n=1 Tax=Tessaracoccus sp. TaxID=1971211 RepID=UPI001EC6FBC9|nr:class F sortase [Tessaracoccus sp.]MBK7821553.1 class F sortase [Tessaracoccus sp.]